MLQGLVYRPPPSMLFEQGHDQGCVVAVAHEPFVELKLCPFEVEFDTVRFVDNLVQLRHESHLAVANELLRLEELQVVVERQVLGDLYFELLGHLLDLRQFKVLLRSGRIHICADFEIRCSQHCELAELVDAPQVQVDWMVFVDVRGRVQDLDAGRLSRVDARTSVVSALRISKASMAPCFVDLHPCIHFE